MLRREFLETSLVALAPAGGKPARAPEWYELRTLRLRMGAQPKVVNDFLAEVALPAFKRAGVGPIGVFETMVGPEMPTLHLLVPYESAAAYAAATAKLAADPAYHQGAIAAAFLDPPAGQPPFVRMEASLLVAFESMPRLELPPGAAERKPRVFELRTYESPSEGAHHRKMEMFTRLGETAIFRRTGLQPVFFGRALVGPRLPSFTYMLAFPDLAAREKAWATFRADPEWLKLKATPGYTDGEVLSNITNLLLRPAGYSMI
jgi:hypothetical protein